MDPKHAKALQTNYVTIVDNIGNPLDLLDKLYSEDVFTVRIKQEVEAKTTSTAQARLILDKIQTRGPTAYNTLYECLVATSNDFAAALLRPYYGGTKGNAQSPPKDVLKEVWPNEDILILTADSVVKPCDRKLNEDSWLSENVYSMKRRCRGRCLIISNKTFQQSCKLETRNGTDKDVTDLKTLFQQLQFNVVVYKDLTAQKIKDVLKTESSLPDHASSDCFICVICSHGTTSGIYGVDGETISERDVIDHFDGNNCRALRDKPKLFFIQACQGEKYDIPVQDADAKDIAHVLQETHIGDATDGSPNDNVQPDALGVNPSPTKAHILVARATYPGYISLRNTLYGSWFLQAVVYVFQRHACEMDINGLLTLVNDLVSRGIYKLNKRDVKQACGFETRLTRPFKFFPGLYAE